MKKLRLLTALVLAFCLLAPQILPARGAETRNATILFTHDLHDHMLPAEKEGGGTYGGYARLMTAIRQEKKEAPDALLLDGGDFSMGSLFQTAYATAALELRIMGAMGYDVTTFGNHEFDYLPAGLASMLTVAADCGEPVPAIVDANYLPPFEGDVGYTEDSAMLWQALDHYGVEPYKILERGGMYYVIFGLMGTDSDDCAPNSGMVLADAAVIAQTTVEVAVKDCLDRYGEDPVVIALSHSGTSDNGKGEDYELAKAVTGIDLIISGHTHSTLEEPIRVGDTWIVSAGEYSKNLGVVTLEKTGESVSLTDYRLVPIDDSMAEDPDIAALVESYKQEVEENYLSAYDMTFDQVVTENPYTFDTVEEVYATAHESTLGNLFADAYKWAAEATLGGPVDMALTASGVIRETMPVGQVTVSDVFNAASLGVGTEGELVAIYLTGKDLKTALEVDASVYPLMSAAQLFFSGVEYSFNTNRMLFNKVDYAMLRRADGSLEAIEDEKLYRVVAGMYVGQMLGSVEETSFGLIQIVPRDEAGNPIAANELVNYVIHDENGTPLKEWYAIAAYLQQMGGTMSEDYAQPDGRKVVYSSWNPVKLLQNANRFTWILLAVAALLLAAVVLLVRRICRRKK